MALHEVVDLLDLLVLFDRLGDAIVNFVFVHLCVRVHRRNVVARSLVVADKPVARDWAIRSPSRRGMRQLHDLENRVALWTDDRLAIEIEECRATAQASALCAKFGFRHGLFLF